MELLYVWIEDYKNIHHQGFNFSPKYRFEFTPEFRKEADGKLPKDKEGKDIFEVIGGTLKDKKLDSISENFFEPSQEVKDAWNKSEKLGTITNITAIIGENGAGKSNLLDFIRYQQRLVWNNSNIPTGCITIIRIGETNFISKSKDWKVDLPNSVIESTEAIYKLEEIPLYIYYSNILNMQKEDTLNLDLSNLIQLSTDFLCSKTEMDFNRIKSWELEYKIFFILFSKSEQIVLPIELPETPKKYSLSLEVEKRPKFIALDGNKRYSQETESSLEEIYTESMNRWSTNLAEILSVMMKVILIQILVREYPNLSPNSSEKSQELNAILGVKGIDFHKKIEIFLEKFNSYRHDQIQTVFINNYKELINKILEILNTNNSNFFSFKEPFEYIPNNTQKIKIDIDENLLIKFFPLLHKIGWTIFNFSWPYQRPSTGEDSLLTLFSRFFSTKIKTNDPKFITINEVRTDNLLILIDEGEVGFHPEWQRKYLKYLIDFFPQIYPDKQIQIILTTHSPFLASDLPKENIIFLKKGEQGEIIESDKSDANGKCIVFDGLKKDKTFGANIHTLLSDGFFLNEGLIGEFAKGKINEIINFYKKVKEIEKILDEEKISNKLEDNRIIMKANHYKVKEDNFWKVQKMIGEEYLAQIIKNHLEELDLILLGKKQAEEKLKKQELERILEKYGIEEIQNFHKDLKRNDKDNL